MEPRDYETWLAGGAAGQSMAASGAELFQSLACVTCHRAADSAGNSGRLARGPALEGLYGSQQKLADGRAVIADDTYIRESILNPTAKLVAGWEPVMPTFQGQVSEEQLTQLIAYIRTLGPAGSSPAGGSGGPNSGPTDMAGGQVDDNSPQSAGPAQQQNRE
jgi:cytochrome c oxidase subunit 2